MSDVTDEDYTLNGKKFAVVMALDVSYSMSNYLEELSNKFNDFVRFAKNNKDVSETMDLALITFGTDVQDEFDGFTDVKGIPEMNFKARGNTNMKEALELATSMARERTHIYKHANIEAYKPWIILMTDGEPNGGIDEIAPAATALKQREADGKVHVFAVGMGPGFNKNVLTSITDKCFAISDWNFEEFFTWLGKSVAMVSTSSPGDKKAICDVGDECQDMMGKFFKVL